MNGTIYCDPWVQNFITDSFRLFWERMAGLLGYALVYDGKVTARNFKGDVAILYNIPSWQHVSERKSKEFFDTKVSLNYLYKNKNIKVVAFNRDLHHVYVENRPELLEMMLRLYCRADLICSHHPNYFQAHYPMFWNKHVFVPYFFGPTQRYVNLKRNPDMSKGLVPGRISSKTYPYRFNAATEGRLDSIPHPSYVNLKEEGTFLGDEYAKKLNQYGFCFTDGSIYYSVLQKHVEIPAAGSLLVAPVATGEFEEFYGMKDGIHYINVLGDYFTKASSHSVRLSLVNVLNNLLLGELDCNVEEVAYAGMKRVRENFNLEAVASKLASQVSVGTNQR